MVKFDVVRKEMVRVLGETLVSELESKEYEEQGEFDLGEPTKSVFFECPYGRVMGSMRKGENKEYFDLCLPEDNPFYKKEIDNRKSECEIYINSINF